MRETISVFAAGSHRTMSLLLLSSIPALVELLVSILTISAICHLFTLQLLSPNWTFTGLYAVPGKGILDKEATTLQHSSGNRIVLFCILYNILRNRSLNGVIFYFLQIAAAQMSNPEAERAWAKKMVSSSFLILAEDNPAENYPILSVSSEGKQHVLVYTDWRQVGMDFEDRPYP